MEVSQYILCLDEKWELNGTKEVPQAELLFSDEITGNLRTMKNVTSSVRDRAENIDRRHLVQMGGAKMKEKFRKLRIKKGVYQNPWN